VSVASAIKERDSTQLPSKRDEDWRWTDLRGLIRQVPAPSAAAVGGLKPDVHTGVQVEDVLVLANGGEVAKTVPDGASHVVRLRVAAVGDGAHVANATFRVGQGATLILFETYESDGASVAQTGLSFTLDEGASIERFVVCDDHAEAVNVSQADVTLGPRSVFAQLVLTTGARRQRIETRVSHPGQGARVRLDSAYLLAGKAHADLTTEVVHNGAHGETDQITRGVVADQARAVFQGRIVVAEGADGTDARMRHDAQIMSDRAEVDAKPELEIYADDVSCAHGNTVGALDEDALFYARQRGIPEAEARALLTEAFVGAVVDRVSAPQFQTWARAWVAERLRGA
jgi:Fe-S cluster assembly protein SufD